MALGQEHCEVKRALCGATGPAELRPECSTARLRAAVPMPRAAPEPVSSSSLQPQPSPSTLLPLRKLQKLKRVSRSGRNGQESPLLSSAPLQGRLEKGPQLHGLAVPWHALSVSLWRRPSFSALQASRRRGLC